MLILIWRLRCTLEFSTFFYRLPLWTTPLTCCMFLVLLPPSNQFLFYWGFPLWFLLQGMWLLWHTWALPVLKLDCDHLYIHIFLCSVSFRISLSVSLLPIELCSARMTVSLPTMSRLHTVCSRNQLRPCIFSCSSFLPRVLHLRTRLSWISRKGMGVVGISVRSLLFVSP